VIQEGVRIYSKVRGVTADNTDGTNRQYIIRKFCHDGDTLEAVPEPNNPHDENAIGLWVGRGWGRHQVGYVGSSLAEDLVEYLDDGGSLDIWITQLTSGGVPLRRGVNIAIMPGRARPAIVEAREAWFARELGAGLRAFALGVGPGLASAYRALPEWGQPIVWGAGIAAPIVIALFVARWLMH
jgi:hypothetical protein